MTIYRESWGESHRQCEVGDIYIEAEGGVLHAYERIAPDPGWHWRDVPVPDLDADLDLAYVRESLGLSKDVAL